GVILYELLTGALPFSSDALRSAGYDALRKTIREVDPPTPSSRVSSQDAKLQEIATKRRVSPGELRRELKGDLDAIVMTALQKDRNRRYQTVNALAADIRRHLRDEPVTASAPTATYRLAKLIRRNKGLFGAIGAVLALLVIAVAGTSWGMLRAQRAEKRANTEAQIAQAVNDFLNRDLLAAVAPSKAAGRGKDVSMREVLDVAAKTIDEESAPGGRFADLPQVERAIRATLGHTYTELGDYAAARPHFERALALSKAEGNPADIGQDYGALGVLSYRQGEYDSAESLLETALGALPADGARTGSNDTDDDASLRDAWRTWLGTVYRAQGRVDDAIGEFRQVIRDSKSRDDELRSALAMQSLAVVYQEIGDDARAESLYVATIEIRRRIFGDEDAESLTLKNNLANTIAGQGRLRDAIPLWNEALAAKRTVYGESHPVTLNSLNNIAEANEILGDYASADSLHAFIVARRSEALGENHPDTIRSRMHLALSRLRLGHGAEAEAMAAAGVESLRRELGADHPRTVDAEGLLGTILLERGKTAQAAALLRHAYDVSAQTQPDDIYTLSIIGADLGIALARQGKRGEAEALWTEAAPGLEPEAETVVICESIAELYEGWQRSAGGSSQRGAAASSMSTTRAAGGSNDDTNVPQADAWAARAEEWRTRAEEIRQELTR
ncbi:MAG: tetratricopeptide repeat protein, partial [Candidatus Eisenbacteria bacterium]|nr:tetratricopeptide repeat protein [Candidatus Eisenbacteria bacterium]